jgi:ABC-type sugar transport system permease subunit
MAAFPVIQFCVFYIGVNANMITKAFSAYDMETGTYVFNGIENFRKLFFELKNNPIYGIALKNSLIAYLLTTGVSLPLSLLMSYYIFKKGAGHKMFRSLLFLPSIISPMVLSTIFRIVTDKIYPELMFKFTGEYVPGLLMSDSRTVFLLACFYTIWTGFGVTTMMYRGAMDGVTPSMLEAARLDGANSVQEFFKVILPNIASTVSTFLTIGVASIFTNQNNLFSFMSINPDPGEENMGYYLYRYTLQNQEGDLTYAAFLGVVFTVIVIPLAFGVRKLFDRSED